MKLADTCDSIEVPTEDMQVSSCVRCLHGS